MGLVERREAPPSALFALVEHNVAARAVRALSRSREAVLEELGKLAREIEPSPTSAVVFGSFVRGAADALSDVDVVLVRPTDVDEDDEPWASSTDAWRSSARRLTGNSVQVLEIAEIEVARRLRRPTELWADAIRDGVVVFGSPLEALRAQRSA